MPGKSGGNAVDSRGMEAVMAAVGDFEKILEELPPDYLLQFEEAALEMMSAFKSRAEPELPSSPEPAEEESAGKERDTKRRKKADKTNPFQQMKDIQYWLRLKVPAEAVVPSEAIIYGHEGTDFAGYTATNTQSVDGFLYEEDDIDELCEAGKLARSYCTSCGSRNIKDLNFISHSLSIRELEFVFKDALRGVLLQVLGLGLDKCCVVDVGSRLGSVLYAACVFGNVSEAIGIEMNSDLCKVQEEALKVFGLGAQARVVCADVRNEAEGGSLTLSQKRTSSCCITSSNFSWKKKAAANAWSKLLGALKPQTIVISCPGMDEQLSSSCTLVEGKALFNRLKPLDVDYPTAQVDKDEYADEDGILFSNIKFYTVLACPPHKGGGGRCIGSSSTT